MNVELIDDSTLSLTRKSLLPGEGFFVLDEFERREADQEAAEVLSGRSVAVVADSDADGLACAALLREVNDGAALIPSGPHEIEDDLARIADHSEPGVTVYVCDLAPDRYEYIADELESVVGHADAVHWIDHHQWPTAVATAVQDAGVDLTVGDSETECTADVVIRSVDYRFPRHLIELAAVTRDHDLWLREDPRSDDLADYAYWAEPEDYVETVRIHGPDLPTDVRSFLDEQRVEKNALIQRAVERAEFIEIGSWTVGVTYGRCSQNEVAETMRERGADASVIVKPAGSASIRGTESFERCHEVARQVNGGGHPKAAGCKPDIYHDMLDYARHWVTEGAIAKQTILDAFWTLSRDSKSAG